MSAPDGKASRTEPVSFTRPAAERIAKVVRKVEAGDRASQALKFERVPTQQLIFKLAKIDTHTLPGNTAEFTIYTGPTGTETATPMTTTAYIRHAAIHTGAYATLARIDGDLEVVEGGYAMRPAFYDASETWQTDDNLNVRFRTGGTATATNLTASIPKWIGDRRCHVVYEADQYTGEAKWGLVSAETYYTRRATYDATSEHPSFLGIEVELSNGGGTVNAVNLGPSLPPWEGTQRECVVSFEDNVWFLHGAETYYTREATYDASNEWLSGGQATVTLLEGGHNVQAENRGPSIGEWTGTKGCIVSFSNGIWYLQSAETYYVRRGTFTGAWSKNANSTVTLTSGGSIQAVNLFGDVGVAGETRNCAVAYEDGTWFLIAAECE